MLKAHKVALDLTNAQSTHLARAAGTARFAYNWALTRWQEQYEAAKTDPQAEKPSQLSLRRELNAIKAEAFPWMADVTKCAPQESIINLGAAFTAFFAGRARYPKFKKRGVHDSFKLTVGSFKVSGDQIRIPKIRWLRMAETYRFPEATPVSATISCTAGRWFVSIVAEIKSVSAPAPADVIGIDVGVHEFVRSDGTRHRVPRAYRASERHLRRAQQALSRKQKGSNNRAKARTKVARIYARTANIRRDWLHKTTTAIANSASVLGVEGLNVQGMTQNRYLAKSVLDAGFAEFRRQLEYKAIERGSRLYVAPQRFPSSKMCSACGTITKSLSLSFRTWTCSACKTTHDRDSNAANNLRDYAASSAVTACGELFAATYTPSGVLASNLDEAGTGHQTSVAGLNRFQRTA